jgi:hypothetical protein
MGMSKRCSTSILAKKWRFSEKAKRSMLAEASEKSTGIRKFMDVFFLVLSSTKVQARRPVVP